MTAPGKNEQSPALAAQRLLARSTAVRMGFLAGTAALFAAGFLLPVASVPQLTAKEILVLKLLVAALFLGVSIICLGVEWAAFIIAARRLRRSGLLSAARTVVISQCISIALCGLFEAAALYYRLRLEGNAAVFAATVAASAVAGWYFTRVPAYLGKRLSA